MKIEQLATGDLIPYVNNSRTHDERQVGQIAASIKEFGFTNPILIDNENGIIAGHGRLQGAQKLGIEQVPCIRLGDLTEAQKKAYVIADNKLALNAGWDMDLLAVEIEGLQALDFDVDLLGFDADELDVLFPLEVEGLTDEDAVPEVPEEPTTKMGDIYQLGNHRLMCGDSTSIDAVELLMGGVKVDMVFTDPPYGIDVVQSNQVGGDGETKLGTVGSSNFVESKTYSKIIGDDTTDTAKAFYALCLSMQMESLVLWGGNYYTEFVPSSRCWLIWDKEMTGNFSQAEMAWTSFKTGGVKVFKFLWNGLSREGNRKDELHSRVHPTQKPVGLFVDIFNRVDDFRTVFDGFGGSGSTLIACEKTNRNAYLMELDPKYCDVIVKRWEDFTGKKAELLS